MAVLPPLQDPSKQIRLLKPRRTAPGETLSFDISVWDLDKAPPYNAISYTWGDPKESSEIPRLLQEEAEQVALIERLEKYLDPEAVTQEYHDEFCTWLDAVEPMRNVAHMELYAMFHRPLRRHNITWGYSRPLLESENFVDNARHLDTAGLIEQIHVQKTELQRIKTKIQDAHASAGQGVMVDDNWNGVRRSCSYVLQQATQWFPHAYLWIDSICIDQSDVKVKSSQVPLMFDIYSGASYVLVGLGPCEDGSDQLLAAMRAFHAVKETLEAMGQHKHSPTTLDPIWYSIHAGFGDMGLASVALSFWSLCQRRYWHRVWIVQENFAARASRFYYMCGSEIVSRDVMRWSHGLFTDPLHSTTILNTMIEERTRKRDASVLFEEGQYKSIERRLPMSRILDTGHQPLLGLREVLEKYEDLNCTDRRDAVYGLLGLVDWTAMGVHPIQPDYSRSMIELALQVRSKVRLDEFAMFSSRLLLRLGINAAALEMQALVQRQHGLGIAVSLPGPCAIGDEIYSHPLYCNLKGNALVECVCLSLKDTGSLSMPAHSSCQQHRRATASRLSRGLHSQQIPFKALKQNDVDIGVVCMEATEGDFLIPSWYDQSIALVLRRSTRVPGRLDLIGQAILASNLGDKSLQSGPGPRCTCPAGSCARFVAEIRLWLSVGDVLALEGQDMLQVIDNPISSSEALQRLVRFPVANRIGSVALKIERCLDQIPGHFEYRAQLDKHDDKYDAILQKYSRDEENLLVSEGPK